MRRLTAAHEGTIIDDVMATHLQGLERGVCVEDCCRCLRRIGTRSCHRCGHARALRPVRVGDIVPGGRGVPLRTTPRPAQGAQGPPAAEPAAPARSVVALEPTLPDDWAERVRRLPHNTLVHIPVALRQRIAALITDICHIVLWLNHAGHAYADEWL